MTKTSIKRISSKMNKANNTKLAGNIVCQQNNNLQKIKFNPNTTIYQEQQKKSQDISINRVHEFLDRHKANQTIIDKYISIYKQVINLDAQKIVDYKKINTYLSSDQINQFLNKTISETINEYICLYTINYNASKFLNEAILTDHQSIKYLIEGKFHIIKTVIQRSAYLGVIPKNESLKEILSNNPEITRSNGLKYKSEDEIQALVKQINNAAYKPISESECRDFVRIYIANQLIEYVKNSVEKTLLQIYIIYAAEDKKLQNKLHNTIQEFEKAAQNNPMFKTTVCVKNDRMPFSLFKKKFENYSKTEQENHLAICKKLNQENNQKGLKIITDLLNNLRDPLLEELKKSYPQFNISIKDSFQIYDSLHIRQLITKLLTDAEYFSVLIKNLRNNSEICQFFQESVIDQLKDYYNFDNAKLELIKTNNNAQGTQLVGADCHNDQIYENS